MGDFSKLCYYYVKGEGVMRNFVTASYNVTKLLFDSAYSIEEDDVANSKEYLDSIHILNQYAEIYKKSYTHNKDMSMIEKFASDDIVNKMQLLLLDDTYNSLESVKKNLAILYFLKYNDTLYMTNANHLPEEEFVFNHAFRDYTPKLLWDLCEKKDWDNCRGRMIKPFSELNEKYLQLKERGYDFSKYKNIVTMFEKCNKNKLLQNGIFSISFLKSPSINYYRDNDITT